MGSGDGALGSASRAKKRLAFPFKIGQYVTLKTDLLLRTALWVLPDARPLSKWAGAEGRIVALNITDSEVNVKGVGWTPVSDLLDPSEISWEDGYEDDPIIDVDDPIFDDDDDDIIFEED